MSDDLKRRADAYFERLGIDPNQKSPSDGLPPIPVAPTQSGTDSIESDGMTTELSTLEVVTYLVYSYVAVQAHTSGHVFEGHAGGLGIGALGGVGPLYYSDLGALLATHDFGVFYAAYNGGVLQVTWGANGNATYAGVGAGGAAMGGRGNWT